MKMLLLRSCLVGAGLFLAQSAFAGEFSVFCSYNNDNIQKCASVIADLVTDKFIAKYPISKYQIFVHSDIHSYSDGGFAAYAVAGVIPKDSAQFPARVFSNSNINGGSTKYSRVQLANTELETYRAAVKNLMEQCEISPACDVYTPRR